MWVERNKHVGHTKSCGWKWSVGRKAPASCDPEVASSVLGEVAGGRGKGCQPWGWITRNRWTQNWEASPQNTLGVSSCQKVFSKCHLQNDKGEILSLLYSVVFRLTDFWELKKKKKALVILHQNLILFRSFFKGEGGMHHYFFNLQVRNASKLQQQKWWKNEILTEKISNPLGSSQGLYFFCIVGSVVGWMVTPSKSYVHVLNPGTCECGLVWKRGICSCN